MRKVRKLSFLGILGALTVVLFLAGISFMQAQLQIQKKPVKPPETTRAVTWIVMSKWLQKFAYKTKVGLWTLGLAGLGKSGRLD